MNIYERAKEKFDLEVAYEQSLVKQRQVRYEWEIDSLIAELPHLIPDGLDWHWDGDGSFVRSHQDGFPKMTLAIGEYEIRDLDIRPMWNSESLSLRVEVWNYEHERMDYVTITSADDPQWLSSPIFDVIYGYVRIMESNRG